MTKEKVLFVDDEKVILRSFSAALNHKGYITSTANSGEEAVQLLRSQHFDIVVTDLKMPGIDGIQVLKEVKLRDQQTAVIVLTGYGDLDSAIDSLRLGADDYLQKPCEVKELLCRIDKCLKQKEVEQQLLVEKQKNIKYEMVTTLASGISHDYNNILTSLMVSLELMQLAETNTSFSEYLDLAMNVCYQAKDLTHKFIQISNMYKPDMQSVQAVELIDNLMRRISAVKSSETEIHSHIDKNIWPVFVDSEKICIALHAIIDNAREAISCDGNIYLNVENFIGSPPDQSRYCAIPDGKFVKIIIRDNGIGISSCNLHKIFDPYYSTKERGSIKGMGLGLTLAEVLVRRCDGHIQVKSKENQGTVVSVFLKTTG